MLCPICKRNAVTIDGYGAQAVCESCDDRALNADGRAPNTNSGNAEGDNPIFIDGHQCWRRYRFGGWITFLDEWDSPTYEAFYATTQGKVAANDTPHSKASQAVVQTRSMNPRDGVAELFDRLDAWRHFPAYQLERRADIFFALYLREVIEGERQVELAETVVPEIPIKHAHNAQSFKADYLLCTPDHSAVYLVEIKTDLRSRRSEQDVYLAQAAEAGITALLQGIRDIVLATNHRRKYFHLLDALSKLGLLRLPSDLENQMFSKSGRNVVKLLRAITVTETQPKVEVVYIQPMPGETPNYVDFERFAKYVGVHSDPLSQRFCESLLRWRTAAGEREVARELAKVGL